MRERSSLLISLLFLDASRWRWKARRIQSFILLFGNFGHNRDQSYFLLKERALYLPRADKFEDQFEGAVCQLVDAER